MQNISSSISSSNNLKSLDTKKLLEIINENELLLKSYTNELYWPNVYNSLTEPIWIGISIQLYEATINNKIIFDKKTKEKLFYLGQVAANLHLKLSTN